METSRRAWYSSKLTTIKACDLISNHVPSTIHLSREKTKTCSKWLVNFSCMYHRRPFRFLCTAPVLDIFLWRICINFHALAVTFVCLQGFKYCRNYSCYNSRVQRLCLLVVCLVGLYYVFLRVSTRLSRIIWNTVRNNCSLTQGLGPHTLLNCYGMWKFQCILGF